MSRTESHLICLFCVTAGQNGENLGADEQQIVEIVYLLYDIANNKVRTVQQCLLYSFDIYTLAFNFIIYMVFTCLKLRSVCVAICLMHVLLAVCCITRNLKNNSHISLLCGAVFR